MQLTPLEQKALDALLVESAGNGHDFGLLELVEWDGDRKALGALVTTLQGKGIVTSIDKVKTDRIWTQFVLSGEYTNH